MIVHTVFFWLKPHLTDVQRVEFVSALKALADIPFHSSFHLGTPAGVADRPVVDKTFDYGISCTFENLEAHNAYQVHPLHVAFLEQGKPKWIRSQVYDAD
jgi:hypothetical protein|uniref:Dabb family protein n=1 Tax=Cephaloticoccus sp. TaxID=1985742 RepID=UPI00404AC0A4